MTSTELTTVEPAPLTLFRTDDPTEVIARATATAEPLAKVIREKELAVRISGREHVRVEGWTLLGSMLGVFPICEWTRTIERDGKPYGFLARVEARTITGAVVGAAEAECTRDEAQWGFNPKSHDGDPLTPRDDFALRSMAQTRATSKALRIPLGFVMSLAGYEATPAEEMGTSVEAAREVLETVEGVQYIEDPDGVPWTPAQCPDHGDWSISRSKLEGDTGFWVRCSTRGGPRTNAKGYCAHAPRALTTAEREGIAQEAEFTETVARPDPPQPKTNREEWWDSFTKECQDKNIERGMIATVMGRSFSPANVEAYIQDAGGFPVGVDALLAAAAEEAPRAD